MTSTKLTIYTAILAALALAACGDSKGAEDTTTDGLTTAPDTTTVDATTDGPTTAPDTPPEDPVDPERFELCKTVEAEKAVVVDTQCVCAVEYGHFPDAAACVAHLGKTAEQVDCTCTLYAKESWSKPVLNCASDAQKALLDCYSMFECSNMEELDNCDFFYLQILGSCPSPLGDFEAELGVACFDEPAFVCGSGENLPQDVVCDFELDCKDGSDEQQMCPTPFECNDGTMIPDYFKCDGHYECPDGSDESGCPPEFMCMDGTTIAAKYVCDGAPSCADGSDELNCP